VIPPIPVVFEPIFKPRPWGGRELERLFGKKLPPGQPIGESWELADLPADVSVVRDGPLAGHALNQLLSMWGKDVSLCGHALLGPARPSLLGRFPLLIKFLDARENLSVQVHPKPQDDDPAHWHAGVKDEAWYVVAAEPGSKVYIGLKPGVTPRDVAERAGTRGIVELLREWPATPGQCFYLPSGTPHALGAGIVVAEVQTPFDVTYRLFDWDRVGLDGEPRELHIEQALANIRYDTVTEHILPTSRAGHGGLVRSPRFQIERCEVPAGQPWTHGGPMRVLIVLSGSGIIVAGTPFLLTEPYERTFSPGDVILVPASGCIQVQPTAAADLLLVSVPPRDQHPQPPPARGHSAKD